MGYKNLPFETLENLFGNFFEARRIQNHFSRNSSQSGDVVGDIPTRVYQRMKSISYLNAIMKENCNFRNAMIFRITSRRLNINYRVHGRKLEFEF